jgi:hypothetical protein
LADKRVPAYPRAGGRRRQAQADPTRTKILDELAERDDRPRPGSAPGWRDEPGIIQTQRQGRCKFHDINTAPLNRVAGRWRRHAAKEST